MTAERNTPDDSSAELDGLLFEYIDRLNAGEILDPSAIERDHPEVASALLDRLQVYRALEQPSAAQGPLGTLGDYTLRRQIGRGGMGVVYEAWENSMDRRVALKVLPPGVAADERACARFLREAQTAGKLSHPNVVPVFFTGVKEQTPFYAMEFVEGETLAQVLAKLKDHPDSPTSFGRTRDDQDLYVSLARCFADVADGLQHAHAKGITHRDIKPSNLILDKDGRLRILDFGLARLEGQESLTISGDVVGTPLYMSPEQARRKKIPIDHRTDVYSLGATLYEMLTLRPPFSGKDHNDTLSQIIERDPVEPRKVNQRVPKDLETIVLKCLRKDAGDRYGTAEAMGQDLRRFVRGEVIEARAQTGWDRICRRAWRHRWRGAALIGAILLVSSSALLIHIYYREARRKAYDLYREHVLRGSVMLQMGEMVIQAQGGGDPSADPVRLFTSGFFRAAGNGGGASPIARALEELDEASRNLPGEPDAYFRKAKGFYLLGNDEEALRALDSATRVAPDFVPATVLRAALLEKGGDRQGALREIEQAKKSQDAVWAESWYSAYTAVAGRRWKEAAEAYAQLISLESGGKERYPGSTLEAHLGRGTANLESQEYVEAIADFSVAMALWPDLTEPAILKGRAYVLLGDATAAERIFAESYRKALFPDEVAQMLVIFYAGSFGRFQPTEFKNVEKALQWAELLKESPVKDVFKSACFSMLGRPKDAEQSARKAVAHDDRNPLAYRPLLWALMRLNRLEEARVVARNALELDHQDAVLHRLFGDVLSMQGKSEEFIAELRTAIRLDPSFVGAHWDLADELNDIGLPEEALPEAEIVVQLAPNWSDAHGTLGSVFAHLGRFDQATRELKEAVRLNPRNPDAYNYWGVALSAEGKLDEAIEMFQESANLDVKKNRPWAHVNLALILEERSNFEDAFLEHCRAIEADPHFDSAHAALPRLFRRIAGSPAAESALDSLAEPLQALLNGGEEHPGLLKTLALARLHARAHRDVEMAFGYIQRAIAKGDGGSGASSILAEALWSKGQRKEAVLILEKALTSISAKRYVAEQVEDYRRRLLPDLVSYRSIDAAIASLNDQRENTDKALPVFRAVAKGEDSADRLLYLEGRLLDQDGAYEEASEKFAQLSIQDPKRPEPILRLAECLRASGHAVDAASRLFSAIQGALGDERAVLESWMTICLADLERAPTEVLAELPDGEEPSSYRADLRWLLERLQAEEPLRIRCGGEEYLDGERLLWAQDRFFVGGERSSPRRPAPRVRPGGLGATERRFPGDDFLPTAYKIPLPRGRYRVTLYFCESHYRTPGRRRFDVLIEGREAFRDVEPLAAGFGTLHSLSAETRVDDGILEIEFVRKIGDPTITAMEIARKD